MQESENSIYQVNLKSILEEKYKYSLDFYFNVYDIRFQNYFQLSSLIGNSSDLDSVDLEKVYNESYNCYFEQSNSDSLPGSNSTSKKLLTKKIFELNYTNTGSKINAAIEDSIGRVMDKLKNHSFINVHEKGDLCFSNSNYQ